MVYDQIIVAKFTFQSWSKSICVGLSPKSVPFLHVSEAFQQKKEAREEEWSK